MKRSLKVTGVRRAGACLALLVLGAAATAARADFRGELHALTTSLRALGDRVIPERQWTDVVSRLADLSTRAEAAGDHGVAIEASVARARAWGDLRRDPAQAATILRMTRERFGDRPLPEVRQVYLTEAEMLARVGDSDAIRRLMVAYKGSPVYDPAPLVYTPDASGSASITMVRPRSAATESRVVLAMQKYLDQALSSAGTRMPDFMFTDLEGLQYSPGSIQGRVMLLDFWVAGSVPWTRNQPFIRQAREKFAAQGFEVIGICQNLGAAGIRQYIAGQPGMTWPQVEGRTARDLIVKLGIPGETSNFLVDRQGRIRGRNLEGSVLLEAVGRLMAEPK